jgi:hypothetical protein
MAGGQVVELATGDELAVGTPQAAALHVVGRQLPTQEVGHLGLYRAGQQPAQAGLRILVLARLARGSAAVRSAC